MIKLHSLPQSFNLLALLCFVLALMSTFISLLLYAISHGDSSFAFPLLSKLKIFKLTNLDTTLPGKPPVITHAVKYSSTSIFDPKGRAHHQKIHTSFAINNTR